MDTGERAAPQRPKLSAYVITYNRAPVIGTCLRALAFADELIVIDKGSTDGTLEIAARLADRVISAPWTPTVEETRAFAVAQCTHDWIMFTDDDECPSSEAIRFIDSELAAPRADIYKLAQRHYILGLHDERAYYWPEHQMRLFRRGTVQHVDTVHGGDRYLSDSIYLIPAESGACLHHLSHRDVAQFIEKTNRYTSQPDRRRSPETGNAIAAFAHERIDHWQRMTDTCAPDSYPAVVAVLRSVYDIVDRLKTWEEEAALDGAALFRDICARLDTAYAAQLSDLAKPHASTETTAMATAAPPDAPAAADTALLSRAVLALRDGVHTLREALDRAHADITAARAETAEARTAAAAQTARASEIEATLGEFSRRHDAIFAEQMADIGAREAARKAMVADHEAAMAAWQQAMAQQTARADMAEERLRRIEASTSWRITAPIRTVLRKLGRS